MINKKGTGEANFAVIGRRQSRAVSTGRQRRSVGGL